MILVSNILQEALMGSRVVKCQFDSEGGEQLKASITIPIENRNCIIGIVKNSSNYIISDAVVVLFEMTKVNDKASLNPLCHSFTDENGCFVFGPLEPSKDYLIKVWTNNTRSKKLIISNDNSSLDLDN